MAEANINWKAIRKRAGSYPQEAFQFVRQGLTHTSSVVHGEGQPAEAERHVNGAQLCMGLRDFAIHQYGLLARTVLAHWGITKTEDFGRIVFALIDAGVMRKSAEDCPEDFQGVFEFDEAFSVHELV
ncbi:MAG: hypothetical protein IT437_06165 [Phycisphaerales bacterium]|nr:hypothetical protein [Phycisphaerales bacterium]